MFELVVKRMYGEERGWFEIGARSNVVYKTGAPLSQSTIALTSEM
jgi:hypothetical protein